jgi:hypothetical protein
LFSIRKSTNCKSVAKLVGQYCGKSDFSNEHEFLSCPYSVFTLKGVIAAYYENGSKKDYKVGIDRSLVNSISKGIDEEIELIKEDKNHEFTYCEIEMNSQSAFDVRGPNRGMM